MVRSGHSIRSLAEIDSSPVALDLQSLVIGPTGEH